MQQKSKKKKKKEKLIKTRPRCLKQTQICNRNIKKFCLMLRKAVYSYKQMVCWKKLNKTSLPGIRKFYSSLNMEKITNADYKYAKKNGKNLE